MRGTITKFAASVVSSRRTSRSGSMISERVNRSPNENMLVTTNAVVNRLTNVEMSSDIENILSCSDHDAHGLDPVLHRHLEHARLRLARDHTDAAVALQV